LLILTTEVNQELFWTGYRGGCSVETMNPEAILAANSVVALREFLNPAMILPGRKVAACVVIGPIPCPFAAELSIE